ncbi:hypothetical protein GcM1_243074 [Golovinomyces cichoracearum]|uniref:Uncharacterized protein n=1 Tax=Golovinomyces cichoracearum TaxID=62708 RepID=A0A420IGD4_9PEZI|nr:hypothetical protein GcM1_243074 [Golovinomyces cichoracearum]
MSIVCVDAKFNGNRGGIGISCDSLEPIQIGVELESGSQRAALYIGILYAMKIPTSNGDVKIVCQMEDCADIVRPKNTLILKKKKRSELEERLFSSCRFCAEGIFPKGGNLKMEPYRKGILKSKMKCATSQAMAALKKIECPDFKFNPPNCLEVLYDNEIRVYSLRGFFSLHKHISSATANVVSVPQRPADKVVDSVPAEKYQKDSSENKISTHKLPRDTPEVDTCASKRVQHDEHPHPNAVFALCSRCVSMVCVFCPDSHPLFQRACSSLKTRYIVVLTTCRQCVHTMAQLSSGKPLMYDALNYLQDTFDHISLSAAYIESSPGFEAVRRLGMTPCTVCNTDGIVKYINVCDLSKECDFECFACDVDIAAGKLSPYLKLDFL